MCKRLLPLIPAGFVVRDVRPIGNQLAILAERRGRRGRCPGCGKLSQRIHSYYQRQLDDLPWQGRRVRIMVRARRFRCMSAECERWTFAEPLAEVGRSARRTERLAELYRYIGLAAGGEAGSLLAA